MQPRDIATREDVLQVLRSLDANYDLRTRNYDPPSGGPQTVLGSVIERIEALWSGPGPIEAHCAAVTDPPPVPADADRIAARIAGQRLPVVADARRSVVIVSDHQDAVLSRDSRIGVCSKDATDEQLRAAVGLGVDMSGLPRVERKPIPGITHLLAFTVTGYTGD